MAFPVTYHSLKLDPRENFQHVLESICNESEDIQLRYPPKYLFVALDSKLLNNFHEISMEGGNGMVIPMLPIRHPQDYNI